MFNDISSHFVFVKEILSLTADNAFFTVFQPVCSVSTKMSKDFWYVSGLSPLSAYAFPASVRAIKSSPPSIALNERSPSKALESIDFSALSLTTSKPRMCPIMLNDECPSISRIPTMPFSIADIFAGRWVVPKYVALTN